MNGATLRRYFWAKHGENNLTKRPLAAKCENKIWNSFFWYKKDQRVDVLVDLWGLAPSQASCNKMGVWKPHTCHGKGEVRSIIETVIVLFCNSRRVNTTKAWDLIILNIFEINYSQLIQYEKLEKLVAFIYACLAKHLILQSKKVIITKICKECCRVLIGLNCQKRLCCQPSKICMWENCVLAQGWPNLCPGEKIAHTDIFKYFFNLRVLNCIRNSARLDIKAHNNRSIWYGLNQL